MAARDRSAIDALAPNVIILDYMWADEDTNWSTLQALRMDPQTARIPLVLCTGAAHAMEELGPRLAELGIRVVLKPFEIDELLEAVRLALEEGRPVEAAEPT